MAGAGLIIGGLAVILFGGILFLGLAIQSEESARTQCDTADAGATPGNETCDATDRTFIGFQSTIVILGIIGVGITLIVLGVMKATKS